MTATITATKTRTIVENGEEITITRAELKKVRHLCYWCPECEVYHLFEGKDFGDVEAVMGIEMPK
jgi:hypothetical protein